VKETPRRVGFGDREHLEGSRFFQFRDAERRHARADLGAAVDVGDRNRRQARQAPLERALTFDSPWLPSCSRIDEHAPALTIDN
jgi:hypothetical protein